MSKFLDAISWPFRKLFGGIKKIPSAFKSVLGGMEIIGEAIIKTFPEEFIDLALVKVSELEAFDVPKSEKRSIFLEWAKAVLDQKGVPWKERLLRALLEILLSLLRGDD
jgi:hypothetical protein